MHSETIPIRFNRFKVLFLPLIVLLGVFTVVHAETPGEAFKIKQDFEFSNHSANIGDTNSPVVTHKGNIYFAWIDPNNRTMIAKKITTGVVTKGVIFEKTTADKYHNMPSVGVDKNGFIHVVGNMHNSPYGKPKGTAPWQYVVSKFPESVSGFNVVGNDAKKTIPGTWISYPFFATDNNGELFASFRHRVQMTGWDPGDMGVGLARYNATSKSWSMLGGTNYIHGYKTLGWSKHGKDNTAYQGYTPKIFFDRNNRMHVTWTVYETTSTNGATWVIYAYSDDGGLTFRKANGQAITLPITEANGDVAARSNKRYYTFTAVGVTIDGKPIVSFRDKVDRAQYWARWAGTSWSNPTVMPSAFPGRFVTDNNGVITTVGSDRLYRSFDCGTTWRNYPISLGSEQGALFDYTYLRETGQLRFQANHINTVRVWTMTSNIAPRVSCGN